MWILTLRALAGADLDAEDDEPAEAIELGSAYPWEGTDRDYKYEEVRLHFFIYEVEISCSWS